MKIELKYGAGKASLDLAGRFEIVEPPGPPRLPSMKEALARALREPVGSPPLRDIAGEAKSAVVSVPDLTRPAPVADALPVIIEELAAGGIGPEKVTVLVATGVHRPLTAAEIKAMLGPSSGAIAAENHSASGVIVKLGETSRGTPVGVNEKACSAGLVVCFGSVAFHFHAGFGGGRKGLVPGLAWGETARRNHLLALSGPGDSWHGGCGPGRLAGNPVHEDLVEAAGMVPVPVFVANLALDGSAAAFDCAAGGMVEAHESLCGRFGGLFSRVLDRPADVVVVSAGGLPKDVNLIQSHKAAAHAAAAVRDGGTLLLAAQCAEGPGHPDLDFWFDKPLGEMKRLSEETGRKYVQTAYSFKQKAARFDFLLMSSLDPAFVKKAGLIPLSCPADAAAFIEAKHGRSFSGLVSPDPSVLLALR